MENAESRLSMYHCMTLCDTATLKKPEFCTCYLVIEYDKFAQFIFIYLFLYCNIKRQGFVLTDCVGSMIANRIWNVGMNIT